VDGESTEACVRLCDLCSVVSACVLGEKEGRTSARGDSVRFLARVSESTSSNPIRISPIS
jgi:hypothetical protein